MGRKKQVPPRRSIGILEDPNSCARSATKTEEVDDDILLDPEVPFFVEVDRSNWVSNQHYDISEVILNNATVMGQEFYGFVFGEDFYRDAKYLVRFRLPNVNEYIGRMKLGHWPVLCAASIYLEVIERRVVEGMESDVVLLSGCFDGPDEGVSGLVHLVNMKFLTLRPVLGVTLSESCSSLRVRVEILKKTFDACGSLFDNTRELWRKSMMNLMAWLRPEVITSDARYGYNGPEDRGIDLRMEIDGTPSGLRKPARFNVAGLYEAIKPSKDALMLEDELPELLPELRPYQRRAVYWMIQREKGVVSGCQGGKER